MGYLNIITLEDAKDYLRVSHSDDDNQIRRMIRSALNMIEEKTRHMLYPRDKNYQLINNEVRVYDGPINTSGTTGLATTVTRYDFSDFSAFTDTDDENTSITLNVGYESPEDIPQPLIQAAFEMIDYWYYKNDGTASMGLISDGAMEVISQYCRFVM